ncbi:MAG TPA: MTH938/NDUFAF3 family protein [Woeseiaceae bacterium]|nr:MTH938/NDUFAF3 family protein [Woeseiaceae bacterium]
MKFTRELPNAVTIRKIAIGEIQIGADTYRKAVALTADEVLGDWHAKPIADLTIDDLDQVLATGPELIVLGTGNNNIFPPREIMFALAKKGIGFEVMDTGAAARTFNVLANEGRKFAAILYV